MSKYEEAKKYRPTGLKFTADEEEPNCGRCDHYWDGYDCCNKCGSEHYWCGYIRTEWEEIKEDKSE